MYEAYKMFQSSNFRDRVYPIVLPDVDIFSFQGQAAYLRHWDQSYKELEAEFKDVANLSPTMTIPLSQRLRDIEATTRFINDFMSSVSDMNVLTSDKHLNSNFQQLIEAIETQMRKSDTTDTSSNASPQEPELASSSQTTGGINIGNISEISGGEINIANGDIDKRSINTDGGAYIGGNVNTSGGDFVGRDKNVAAGERGVAIGGNVSGSTIITGDRNVVGSTDTLQQEYIQHIFEAIESRPDTDPVDKEDLKAAVQEIRKEDSKGETADETFIARRLRNIQRMAPDILDVVIEMIKNPVAGFGFVVRNVVEKNKY